MASSHEPAPSNVVIDWLSTEMLGNLAMDSLSMVSVLGLKAVTSHFLTLS